MKLVPKAASHSVRDHLSWKQTVARLFYSTGKSSRANLQLGMLNILMANLLKSKFLPSTKSFAFVTKNLSLIMYLIFVFIVDKWNEANSYSCCPCKFSKLENVHIRLAPLKCYVGRFDFFLGFSRVITGICSRPWSDCIFAEYNFTLNK